MMAKSNVNDVALTSVYLALGLFHNFFLCCVSIAGFEKLIPDCLGMPLLPIFYYLYMYVNIYIYIYIYIYHTLQSPSDEMMNLIYTLLMKLT